jgi:septal ring factor EnvC (AmiA/AmiB activator)
MIYRGLFPALLLSSLLCISTSGVGQNQTVRHHDKLRKVRDEINKVEKKLEANKKQENSELYLLRNLDLDMDIAQSLVHDLREEEKQKAREIKVIEKNLDENKKELERLKQLFSKRLIYIYKYGRLKDVELLLTARSFNDGMLWLEYQKRLSDHDYRSYVGIGEKRDKISRDKDLLSIELDNKRNLITEKVAEEKKLKNKRKAREEMLTKVRRSTKLLEQELAEKRDAAEAIQRMIEQEERRQEEMLRPETLFADLRGRMLWPAQGKVITKFGTYKHPELKTVTENIGIEIDAELGSPVLGVASGKVTMIRWQRGRGNIVIVRHYGGYYSVYTHLGEIYVNEQEEVNMGQQIGTVGESGSLKGPILHFEIWKGTEKLDPEDWLAKNT